MLTAMDTARYFINLFKDEEEGITNLKLQKLLYYAQGFSYQRFGTPLFDDEIEAWENGPVVNEVYQNYKSYQRDPIRDRADVMVPVETERLLLDVAREYGQFTSSVLVGKTHRPGTPWKKTYIPNRVHNTIPKTEIRDYFASGSETLPTFDIDDCFSEADYRTIDKDTAIPLSEWDYD